MEICWQWQQVLWSDVSKFLIQIIVNMCRGGLERYSCDHLHPSVEHSGGSVLVWRGVAAISVGYLVKPDGKVPPDFDPLWYNIWKVYAARAVKAYPDRQIIKRNTISHWLCSPEPALQQYWRILFCSLSREQNKRQCPKKGFECRSCQLFQKTTLRNYKKAFLRFQAVLKNYDGDTKYWPSSSLHLYKICYCLIYYISINVCTFVHVKKFAQHSVISTWNMP